MRSSTITLLVIIFVLAASLALTLARFPSITTTPLQPFPHDSAWVEVVPDPTIHIVHAGNHGGLPLISYDTATRTVTTNDTYHALIAWSDHGCTDIVAYNGLECGAYLVRFDDAARKIVYATDVRGIGRLDHSQYWNDVSVYLNRDLVMIVGTESAGAYREIRRLDDGSLILTDQSFNRAWKQNLVEVK